MDIHNLGDLIYILSKDIKKTMDNYLKQKNIGFGQFQTLMVIKRLIKKGEVTQELITKEMDIDKSNVSRNISRLQKSGYIKIYTSKIDSRKNKISLTKLAEDELEGLVPILQEVSNKMISGISREELEITITCLEKASKKFEWRFLNMKIGIYYFSGTGNTAFIAKYFSSLVEALNKDTKKHEVNFCDISNEPEVRKDLDLLMIGGPIYAGNMPEKLIRWVIHNIPQNSKNTKAVIYSTSTGLKNAFGVDSIASKLTKKGYEVILKECFEMPRNFYFGRYGAHDENEIDKRIYNAKKKIKIMFDYIFEKNISDIIPLEITHKGILMKDMTAELFSIMAKFMGKNYKANQKCIRCQKCVKNCPKKNIKLGDKGIEFSNKCMMCTKCFHICPVGAISYKGKNYDQYNRFL